MILNLVITLASILLILWGSVSCGRQEIAESKGPKNSWPSVSSVRILPEHPTKGSILSLVIQSKDPDDKPVVCEHVESFSQRRAADAELLKEFAFRWDSVSDPEIAAAYGLSQALLHLFCLGH